jgi:hypothetical protein
VILRRRDCNLTEKQLLREFAAICQHLAIVLLQAIIGLCNLASGIGLNRQR